MAGLCLPSAHFPSASGQAVTECKQAAQCLMPDASTYAHCLQPMLLMGVLSRKRLYGSTKWEMLCTAHRSALHCMQHTDCFCFVHVDSFCTLHPFSLTKHNGIHKLSNILPCAGPKHSTLFRKQLRSLQPWLGVQVHVRLGPP